MQNKKLSSFLKENKSKVFSWGDWDCIHFVANWIDYQGKPLFDKFEDWDYHDIKAARKSYVKFLKGHGCRSISEVFDKFYDRSDSIPPRGSIVAKRTNSLSGVALGIVDGYRGIFVGHEGYVSLPLDPETDRYWIL